MATPEPRPQAYLTSAAHESARSLFRLTLYTAVRGGDANLRGHAMADVAAQHNAVGYPEDALQVISIASGDDRTDPAVRTVLQAVKARAHATLGDTDACYHAIEAVEATQAAHTSQAAQAGLVGGPDSPGWLATVATPARVAAGIGHALATLAVTTDNPTVAEQAHQRLTQAVDAFDATAHARPHALCVAQLAVLHLRGEQVDQGAAWGRLALLSAATVHSARLNHTITRIRGLAANHPDQAEAKALVEEIDSMTGGPQDGSDG